MYFRANLCWNAIIEATSLRGRANCIAAMSEIGHESRERSEASTEAGGEPVFVFDLWVEFIDRGVVPEGIEREAWEAGLRALISGDSEIPNAVERARERANRCFAEALEDLLELQGRENTERP